jgi:ribonucleotide reductase beta subunit family protein with ferritin-like domain
MSKSYNNTIEPLLDPQNERLATFPIKYPKIWDAYKEQLAAFWKAEEIDFSRDYDDFNKLDENEQHFIKRILSFFASADGIVNFNLRERILKEIKMTEAQICYSFQMMMENIHGEVYSLMLENIIKDPVEKNKLFNSISNVDSIKLMADWAFKWTNKETNIIRIIVAYAAVEGIFFSSAFAAIFWLKKYRNKGKNIMNGLIKSNQLIARDEGCHTKFACLLYSTVINRLEQKEVYEIIGSAVNICKIFTKDAIKCDLIGMNLNLMNQYIEYVGDTLLVMLGYKKKYNTSNPFSFMESIGLTNKQNFFEARPTEYQSAYNDKNKSKKTITILKNF